MDTVAFCKFKVRASEYFSTLNLLEFTAYFVDHNKVRTEMASFWSDKPDTVEGMMLDSNATDIDAEEAPEILSYLPSLDEKRILEIGSGIG